MDRQAKKLQSVREDGRLGEESFVEGEEADKEVRDLFLGKNKQQFSFAQ